MLKWRVLTAIFLIPLVIAALWLPSNYFYFIALGLFLLAANEWANFCGYQKSSKIIFMAGFGLMIVAVYFIRYHYPPVCLPIVGTFLNIPILIWLLNYKNKASLGLQAPLSRAILGYVALSCAFASLIFIQYFSPLLLLTLLLLVWSTDTLAYFSGKKWGKTPFAPYISPNKTKAGFWGGLIGTSAFSILLYPWVREYFPYFLQWISVVYLTILLAVQGDLFESLMKRIASIKDSGRLLPGHGGILDRIDSLITTLPFFATCIYWINR